MKDDQVKAAIARKFRRIGSQAFFARVKGVDVDQRTCVMYTDSDDFIYEDVLLYGCTNPDMKGIVTIPKVDSQVVVARLMGSDNLYVVQYSEVEKVLITIGESTFTMTENGFTLTKENCGLLATLTALCDTISKLTVSTAVGPSSVPINVADFAEIKNDLTKYLEG